MEPFTERDGGLVYLFVQNLSYRRIWISPPRTLLARAILLSPDTLSKDPSSYLAKSELLFVRPSHLASGSRGVSG